MSSEKICNFCKKSQDQQQKFSLCSRCKTTRYCDVNCQKKDWPTHKLTCKPYSNDEINLEFLQCLEANNYDRANQLLSKFDINCRYESVATSEEERKKKDVYWKIELSKEKFSRTALHLACEKEREKRNLEIIKRLIEKVKIEKKIDINVRDAQGDTALLTLCMNLSRSKKDEEGELNALKLLLENKANPNICDKASYHPIHRMTEICPGKKFFELMLSHGAKINCIDECHFTPLHYILEKGEPEIELVKYLVSIKADPNMRGAGKSSLHLMCLNDSFDSETCKYLIQMGNNVNQREGMGYQPPIMTAVIDGRSLSVIKTLVSCGADVNLTDQLGCTTLYWAKNYGKKKIAKYLESVGGISKGQGGFGFGMFGRGEESDEDSDE